MSYILKYFINQCKWFISIDFSWWHTIQILDAFINQINSFISEEILTETDGQELILSAFNIIEKTNNTINVIPCIKDVTVEDTQSGDELKSIYADDEKSIVKIINYPNPVIDILTIESNTSDHLSIKITSINGQMICNGIMDGSILELNLSTYTKGVYFLSIKSNDITTVKKIIKLFHGAGDPI